MKFKVVAVIIFLICHSLIVAVTPAQAIEPWKISISSNLTNIEQFENRELKFTVSISDKVVINHLKQPGSYIGGGAILTSLTPPEYTNEARGLTKSKKLYECYTWKPNALGGNEGGTALLGVKTGDDNQIDLQFRCWFPLGMKIQNYALSIRLSVYLNNSCCSAPIPNFWDNTQIFYFGNYPESVRAPWWRSNSAGNLRLNIISEMPEINVIRSAPRTSFEFLSVSSNKLKEETVKLKSKSQTVVEANLKYLKAFETTDKKLESILIRAVNLEAQNFNSKYLIEIQKVINQIKSKQSEIAELFKLFNGITPGSMENNAKYNYLFALDMETAWQPEILSVVYPNPNSISPETTPYLRLNVRSKTPIISTDIALTYSEECCANFKGNVIIPGAPAFNYQAGAGLVLIENQQWVGSYFQITLLISPMYTPIDKYQIGILSKPSCALALIEDAAGNFSNYWNWPPNSYYWPQTLECNPRTTQTIDEAKDFDNLKQLYNNFAQANEDFQKLKIITGDLESKLSVFLSFSAVTDEFTSQLDLLDARLSEEKIVLANAAAELKAKQEADAKAAAEFKAKQEPDAKAAALKKTTINCIKGKLSKKVTAVKPKCPTGYKLKK